MKLFLIVAMFAVTSIPAFAQNKEEVKETHTFVTETTVDSKLQDRDRIIILDVGTDWCHWCKKLEAESIPVAEKKYGDQLRVYHIDGEESTWIIKRHITYSLPGITLVRNGRVLARSHGYLGPQAFLSWIRDGLNGRGKFHTKADREGEETEATKLILTKAQIEKLEKSTQ